MSSWPKISIITPSFNQGQFIEQTILSVINQNYPNLEYIIIDGGSTDNTIDIIKKYEKQITYWVSEPDRGQSDAINKGLSMATGDIVNWLNSDDYYEPNALKVIAEAFSENSNTQVVCAKSRLFKDDNETVGFTKGTDIYTGNIEKTIGWARIDQPETFFKRSVFDKTELIDEDLIYLMDRDLWIKYLLHYGLENVIKIDNVIVNFRLHNSSKTVSQGSHFQKEHDSWFYAFAKQNELIEYTHKIKENFEVNSNFVIKNLSKIDVNLAKKIINYFLFLRAVEFYSQNKKIKANHLFKIVNGSLLSGNDVKSLKKLEFRNKFIPSILLSFIRKNR
jgi:glycosyltransferase involved in cell wall biosynthesis